MPSWTTLGHASVRLHFVETSRSWHPARQMASVIYCDNHNQIGGTKQITGREYAHHGIHPAAWLRLGAEGAFGHKP